MIVCEVTDQKDQTNGKRPAKLAKSVDANGDELASKTKNFVENITSSDQIAEILPANIQKKVKVVIQLSPYGHIAEMKQLINKNNLSWII